MKFWVCYDSAKTKKMISENLVNASVTDDDIPKCKRSDSNIDTCLKNAIQETFAKMVSGN